MFHIQGGYGLIQQQASCLLGQQHGNPRALAFTTGERVDRAMLELAESGVLNGPGDQPVVFLVIASQRSAPGVAPQGNQLANRQTVGSWRMLGQVAHIAGKFPCTRAPEGFAQKPDIAG